MAELSYYCHFGECFPLNRKLEHACVKDYGVTWDTVIDWVKFASHLDVNARS